MNQSPCSDIQTTLARLESKLDKLDRTINPPFWEKALFFIGRNFFSIVLLIIVIILALKGYEMYLDILARIEEIKNIPSDALESGKDSVENLIDVIKFW